MNDYKVLVITNVGVYSFKNLIAATETQAISIAEGEIIQATGAEVLESKVILIKKDVFKNGSN